MASCSFDETVRLSGQDHQPARLLCSDALQQAVEFLQDLLTEDIRAGLHLVEAQPDDVVLICLASEMQGLAGVIHQAAPAGRSISRAPP
jgi:hypothetical protein